MISNGIFRDVNQILPDKEIKEYEKRMVNCSKMKEIRG